MARRGPPPKPTHLKLVTGNPGKGRINRNEPKPQLGRPDPPDWLTEGARRQWEATTPLLEAMQVLATVDRDALAAYCTAFSRWRQAEAFIAEKGEFYAVMDDRDPKKVKYLQQYPQVATARHLYATIRAYQQEFGMTPAARTRIELPMGGGGLVPVASGIDPGDEIDPFA